MTPDEIRVPDLTPLQMLKYHVVVRRIALGAIRHMTQEEFIARRHWGGSWALDFGFLLKSDEVWLDRIDGKQTQRPEEGVVFYATPDEFLAAAARIDSRRSDALLSHSPDTAAQEIRWIDANGDTRRGTVDHALQAMVGFGSGMIGTMCSYVRPRDYQFETARCLHDMILYSTWNDLERISGEHGLHWHEPPRLWSHTDCFQEILRRMKRTDPRNRAIWSLARGLSDEQHTSVTPSMDDSLFAALNRMLAEHDFLMDAYENPRETPRPVMSRYVDSRPEIEEWWFRVEERRRKLVTNLNAAEMFYPTAVQTDAFGNVKLLVYQVFDRMFHPNSFTLAAVCRNIGRFGLLDEVSKLLDEGGDVALGGLN